MIRIYHSTARSSALTQVTEPKKGAWVHVTEPTDEELGQIATQYHLDFDILKDATDLYEAPRIERDGETAYIFTRYCFPEGLYIATEPLLIIYTADYLITVMRRESPVLQNITDGKISVVTSQRTKAIVELLLTINNSYKQYMKEVSRRILAIRSQLSKTDIKNSDFIEFIDLEENLNEFLSALQPQAAMLRSLLNGKFLPLYEEDKDLIEDLSLSASELIELIQSRLITISNTREAYATIMANSLNRTFKRLTSISIFMTIPTITAGLYGMNLALPLQKNHYAFWIILAIVMSITSITIWYFQKKRWL